MAEHRITRHRRDIEALFAGSPGEHLSARDVQARLADAGSSAGTATVYRQLDALVGEGVLRRYDNGTGVAACYEYAADGSSCGDASCFHCVCSSCGKLVHVDCGHLADVRAHLAREHDFVVDPMRTVLHGLCADCARKAS